MIHVGLPVASAGTIHVGNHIHIDQQSFVVTKVGGAAFDMEPIPPPADECPNIYANGRTIQVLTTAGWLNVHPGPPPTDGTMSLP